MGDREGAGGIGAHELDKDPGRPAPPGRAVTRRLGEQGGELGVERPGGEEDVYEAAAGDLDLFAEGRAERGIGPEGCGEPLGDLPPLSPRPPCGQHGEVGR